MKCLVDAEGCRRELLFYGADIESDIRFTRLDTGEQVGVNYHPQKVVNPMKILMRAIGKDATQEDKESFPKRFQEMVHTLFKEKELKTTEKPKITPQSQQNQ